MHLFEEYLNRHNMDVPSVQHCAAGTLIVRQNMNYKILFINRVLEDSRPSSYQICLKSPVHDGHVKKNVFVIKNIINVKWQEYEDFFLKFIDLVDPSSYLTTAEETNLAFWEIFTYVCDAHFANKCFRFQKLLFASLDESIAWKDRLNYKEEIINILAQDDNYTFNLWQTNFSNHVMHYAEWLAKLLASKKKNRNIL